MKKPALRERRSSLKDFQETKWTKSSKSVGEYIFRRLSIDQSDKELSRIRPRHHMSKLIISSKEIDIYVKDYLRMMDNRTESTGEYRSEVKRARSNSGGNQPHYVIHS
tara:strand:- start:925 stop:1248 length:324 start_codon:yes stop_codon:yes gene_type:complete